MNDWTAKNDGRDWARIIMSRVDRGHAVLPAVETMARAALDLHLPDKNAADVLARAKARTQGARA